MTSTPRPESVRDDEMEPVRAATEAESMMVFEAMESTVHFDYGKYAADAGQEEVLAMGSLWWIGHGRCAGIRIGGLLLCARQKQARLRHQRTARAHAGEGA